MTLHHAEPVDGSAEFLGSDAQGEPGTRYRGEDAQGNWLWLVELSSWKRALAVGDGAGTFTPALTHHFVVVDYLEPAPASLAAMRQRVARAGWTNLGLVRGHPHEIPYQGATFDCVTLEGRTSQLSTSAVESGSPYVPARVLAECRRVVAPGGCMVVSTASLAGHGPARSPRGLKRLLARAGFARVVTFYIAPSHQLPISMIPAARGPVLVYEARENRFAAHPRLRHAVAWLGCHGLLFSSQIVIAYT